LLAKAGERFGTRPSALLCIEPDDPLALSVDIAADLHLRLLEAKQAEQVNEQMEAMKHGHR
jgi:hypothetical protein